MSLSGQQKITASLLIPYWTALFVATHIPVPQVVQEADVSDKGLHILANLILVFLFWFTVSDGKKANWRKAAPWCVLVITLAYAIFDEWTQSFVAGRSCDPGDLLADLVGTCTGLVAFSFFSFWPAGLLLTAAAILIWANIAQTNLADLIPAANALFHLISYAVLTAMWIQCMRLFVPTINRRRARAKWPVTASAASAVLLVITKLSSMIFSKEWTVVDTGVSAVATAVVITVFYLRAVSYKGTQETEKIDHSD
ncbi:MAG: VanZ family protein [Phycisphaerales bacterium]|nr:MAG: VanZ family protein [Phycisphaerales bacterium]